GLKTLDYRSDLWSLAVIAFQCMTGTRPFTGGGGLEDIALQIVARPLPAPSEVDPDLPPAFDAWWRRAAARAPAKRFQSAKELADALALALDLTCVEPARSSVLPADEHAPTAFAAADRSGPAASTRSPATSESAPIPLHSRRDAVTTTDRPRTPSTP